VEHNERDTYRCRVTFEDNKGERFVKYTKSYDTPGTARGQGTYVAGVHSNKNVRWISKELQKADWQTVDVIK
jgi:hypothetical protein